MVVGIKKGVDSSTQRVFETLAATSDDVVLMTGNMPKYYYKYGMNQILRKLCPSVSTSYCNNFYVISYSQEKSIERRSRYVTLPW